MIVQRLLRVCCGWKWLFKSGSEGLGFVRRSWWWRRERSFQNLQILATMISFVKKRRRWNTHRRLDSHFLSPHEGLQRRFFPIKWRSLKPNSLYMIIWSASEWGDTSITECHAQFVVSPPFLRKIMPILLVMFTGASDVSLSERRPSGWFSSVKWIGHTM